MSAKTLQVSESTSVVSSVITTALGRFAHSISDADLCLLGSTW